MNKIDLKLLSLKLTMLLALTSANRAHELKILDIRYMVRHESFYIFHFAQPTKTAKPGKKKEPLKFSKFNEDPELCPVRQNVKFYLEKTKDLRKDKHQLLLSYIKPHVQVSTSIISRWIVNVLSLAEIDTKQFRGHSTRSASTSKAFDLGVLTKE